LIITLDHRILPWNREAAYCGTATSRGITSIHADDFVHTSCLKHTEARVFLRVAFVFYKKFGLRRWRVLGRYAFMTLYMTIQAASVQV
jgi:hypothetical protein